MKASHIIASALVAFALASPILEERYLVTSVVIETATVTVTGSRGWRSWSRPTGSNTVSVIPTSSKVSISSQSTSKTIATTPSTSPTSSPQAPASSSIATTSSSSPPAQSSSSGGSGAISSYADPILRQHNLHRSNHTSPDIQWNSTLAATAQKIAQSCVYAHDVKTDNGGYGQNIGAGAPPNEIDKMITNSMYNGEMMLYPGYSGEPNMADFHQWGHFSQIVWKDTVSVGCYTQHCEGGLQNVGSNVSPYFTVCNYYPSGKWPFTVQNRALLTA